MDRIIRFLDLDPDLRIKKVMSPSVALRFCTPLLFTHIHTCPCQARPSRGFATPYNGTDSAFPGTMRLLNRFYAHANRELCSLTAYLDAARGSSTG